MRSAELAAVAGVTVRTLRHYHQVGVLPEPPRRSNGYREYDVRDLVRVLRILRLASLGIPLDRMAEILDGDAAPDALLDELDRELESRIAELVAQRELVAQIRRERLAPDLPPDVGRVSSRLEDPRSERDLSVLLAHLTDDPTRARLVAYYDRATSPEMIASSDALVRRFSALAPDSSDAEIEAVAAEFVEQIRVLDPPLDLGLVDERRSRALLDGYLRSRHNAAQVAVLDRVAARLG